MFVRRGSTSESDGWRADAVELEVEVVGADREPRRERSRRRSSCSSCGQVGERLGRVEVVLVRAGERVGPDAEQVEARLLAARRDRARRAGRRPTPGPRRRPSAPASRDVDGRRRPVAGRGAARSAAGRAPTPRAACSTRSSSLRTRRAAAAAMCSRTCVV